MKSVNGRIWNRMGEFWSNITEPPLPPLCDNCRDDFYSARNSPPKADPRYE